MNFIEEFQIIGEIDIIDIPIFMAADICHIILYSHMYLLLKRIMLSMKIIGGILAKEIEKEVNEIYDNVIKLRNKDNKILLTDNVLHELEKIGIIEYFQM